MIVSHEDGLQRMNGSSLDNILGFGYSFLPIVMKNEVYTTPATISYIRPLLDLGEGVAPITRMKLT